LLPAFANLLTFRCVTPLYVLFAPQLTSSSDSSPKQKDGAPNLWSAYWSTHQLRFSNQPFEDSNIHQSLGKARL